MSNAIAYIDSGVSLSDESKNLFAKIIKDELSNFSEINKIVLFGSFVHSGRPSDIDIAIFQNSDMDYLKLAMKYRKALRDLSKEIPLDVIPLRDGIGGIFLHEIDKGKVIYEKRD